MTSDRSAQIRWMEWGDEAFIEAEKQDKLILLDIGASWCHWCHVMDRVTYSNPEVIKMVNDRFIPVRVEGDKRPDVQIRYLLGGWPTTAWLIPDGRILTGTTFVPPEAMILKLEEVDTLYHENKELVTMQVTSMEAGAEADRTEAEISIETLYVETAESLSTVLRHEYDSEHGGFGNAPKFPFPDAIRFAFLRYHKTGDEGMLNMALKSLDSMMAIYDPVWGGFYRYAVNADWTDPHYEKLLYVQASAMDNYLEAYQITADEKYAETAAGIKAYVMKFLADSDKSGFYGSQDADVGSNDPNAVLIVGEDYFPKNENDRLAVGIPYVDKTIYTDSNGMMISSFLKLYQVMGDEHALNFALKTIDRVLSDNAADGHMYHYSDGERKGPGILSDQVHFAQALIDAYQSTGIRSYLTKAEELVAFMVSDLQDVVDGGFYFRIFDPHAKVETLERHKPFDENVAAVGLLARMSHLTGNDDYCNLAERTMKSVSYPHVTESIIGMGYGVAAETFMTMPVHIVLVGDRDNAEMKKMLQTSLHIYDPEKLVQLLDTKDGAPAIGAMTYEPGEQPVAYICVQRVCHPPAKGLAELTLILNELLNENGGE